MDMLSLVCLMLSVVTVAHCKAIEGSLLHFPKQDGNSGTIYSENLGVVLTRLGTLELGGSEYSHTFGIPLMQQKIVPELKTCPADMNKCIHKDRFGINCTSETVFYFCQRFRQSISAYKEQQKLLKTEYEENMKAINALLPKEITPRRLAKKFKRGLLDAGGWLAKQLFGVATENDLGILSSHIIQLEEMISQSNMTFNTFQENLQSLSLGLNQRMENIKKGLSIHSKILNETLMHITKIDEAVINVQPQLNTFYKRQHKIMKYINVLHIFNVQHIHLLNAFVRDSAETLQGIQSLVEGFLPAIFIPPHILNEYLENLDSFLKDNHPGFRVTHKRAEYYYHVQNIMYARTSKNLFISIKIPLSSVDNVFQLYNVNTLLVPMEGFGMHSKIYNVPEYVAMSQNGQFYLELSGSDIKDCTGKLIKQCNQIMAVKDKNIKSCISSIFFENNEEALKLCKARVFGNKTKLETKIFDIGKGNMLVSTDDPNWIKSCPSQLPVQLKGCVYCIVKLPCFCSIRGKNFFIPPYVSNCFSSTNVQFIRPYNAIFSKHFNIDNELLKVQETPGMINSNKILEPLKVNFKKSDWDDVLKEDKDLNLEIETLAKLMQKGKPLFATPADKLKYELEWLTNGHTKPILIGVTSFGVFISLASIAFNIILLRKMSKIMGIITSLSLLATESNAKALDNATYVDNNMCSATLMLFLLICATIIIILVVKKKSVFATRKRACAKDVILDMLECDLYLYVYNERGSDNIFLCKIPFGIDFISFGEQSLKSVSLKKTWMNCTMKLLWAENAIPIRNARSNYNPPNSIPVSKHEENKIRNILRKGKTFKVVALNNEKAISAPCNSMEIQPDECVFNKLNKLTTARWSKSKTTIQLT